MAGDRQIRITFLGDATSALAAVGAIETDLGRVGRATVGAGKALSAGLTAPIVGVAGASVKFAVDFDTAFTGVKKTIDATDAQFAELDATIKRMSTESPASAVEIAGVMEMAGALGVPIDQMEKFTKVAIDLGETTNMSAEDAATSLAKFFNITGQGLDVVDRAGAALVALGNDGASTEAEIAEMTLRLAAAGHTVGLSEAQILGYAGALASLGLEAEGGGTAMSRVWIEQAKAVADGGDALKAFADVAGMTGDEYARLFKDDASAATVAFIGGLARLQDEGANVFQVLDDLGLGEIRVRDALLRASGGVGLLNEQLAVADKAWADNTALSEEARKRYESVAAQFDILKNKLKLVAIELGEVLLPFVTQLLDNAQPLINMLMGAVQWFGELDPKIQMVVIGFFALLAAIGPILLVLGGLALSITSIMTLGTMLGVGTLPMLTGAFATLAGAAGIGAVIAALTLLWLKWDETYQRGLEANAQLQAMIDADPTSPAAKEAFEKLSGTHAIESPWGTIFGKKTGAPQAPPPARGGFEGEGFLGAYVMPESMMPVVPPPTSGGGGLRFNPNVRLDTSQIDDQRKAHWTSGLEGEFATGGVVPGPVGAPFRALVHGGETIIPPGKGVGGVVINVHGSVIGTMAELERMVVAALNDAKQRGGLGFA